MTLNSTDLSWVLFQFSLCSISITLFSNPKKLSFPRFFFFLIKHRKLKIHLKQIYIQWNWVVDIQEKHLFSQDHILETDWQHNCLLVKSFLWHNVHGTQHQCQVQISWRQDGCKAHLLINFWNYIWLLVWLHIWPNYEA